MDPPRNCSGQSREVACPRQKVELEDLLNELKLDRADEERTTQILKRLSNITSKSTWKGPLPNLRDTFQQEEVNRILMNIVDHTSRKEADSFKSFDIISFIARTGYKHEPEIDKDGKILLHLTTPLHVAAKYEHNADMNFLILPVLFEIYGDDLNYTDELGVTHFHVACMYSCAIEIVSKFLELGQDPNLLVESTGDRPIHFALNRGSWKALLMLLQKGADPNVPNKLGRTPLQFAVANLWIQQFDLLWNNGANLSNFFLPTFSLFETGIDFFFIGVSIEGYYKFHGITSPIMQIVGFLEKNGYELDRIEALTIMKLYSKYGLFEKSADAEKLLRSDEKFAKKSKKIMMKEYLSLYDLLQLRPKEAAKLFAYEGHLDHEWNWSKKLWDCKKHRNTCAMHLSEKISRKFFLDWAIDSFCELIHHRLPILCCHMILENLNNEDLYNICLASTSQNHEDSVEDVITNAIKCNNKRPMESEGQEAPKKSKI